MSGNDDLYNKLTKFIEETSTKQAEDIKKHMKKEVDDIKQTISGEITKRQELEKEVQELKNKCNLLEKELRKNNVIIFNLGYNKEENILEFTINKLNQLLQLNINKETVDNIFTIGKKKENKPIIVKFTSYVVKQLILKNCRKLKGTKISISEELTLEDRRKQKILRHHLKKARSKNLNAYIKRDKLYINGEEYKAEELIDNEEDSECEEKETHSIDQKKANSAPPTPSTERQKNSNTEPEYVDSQEEKEESGNINKKKKVNYSSTANLPRSSSRLLEKDKTKY